MNVLYNSYRSNIKKYVLFIIVVFFVFIIKIALIQIVSADEIIEKYGPSSIYITKVTPGPRGDIYDRNGRKLVTNIRKYNFWIDGKNIADLSNLENTI